MDTISESQEKIRKSLRIHRTTSASIDLPKKRPATQPKPGKSEAPRKKCITTEMIVSSEIDHDERAANEDVYIAVAKASKIRKEAFETKKFSKPDDTEVFYANENSGNSADQRERGEKEFGNHEPMESECEQEEDCVDGVLMEFNKDIGSLYSKTNAIESDVKEIKRIMTARRPTSTCSIRSIASRFKQKSAYSMLPKFPLIKKQHVRQMESDINDEEKDGYEDQLIQLCASYGGDSPKEIVINIFKKLFSPKLKTKYCWVGSKKGRGKDAFKNFLGIREAIWSAVKIQFGHCTEKMITKEFKLRLNQAPKDYAREKEKKLKSKENQRNEY